MKTDTKQDQCPATTQRDFKLVDIYAKYAKSVLDALDQAIVEIENLEIDNIESDIPDPLFIPGDWVEPVVHAHLDIDKLFMETEEERDFPEIVPRLVTHIMYKKYGENTNMPDGEGWYCYIATDPIGIRPVHEKWLEEAYDEESAESAEVSTCKHLHLDDDGICTSCCAHVEAA